MATGLKLNLGLIDNILDFKGWDRRRLAKELGVHQNTLHVILKRNSVTLRTVNRLAGALQIEAIKLLDH